MHILNSDERGSHSHACTPEQRGCAYFQRAGNIMDVCDAESVAVQRGDGRIVAVNYWGSLKFHFKADIF